MNSKNYIDFCNDFEKIYSKPFTFILNDINKLFLKSEFKIKFDTNYNLNNYIENITIFKDTTFSYNFFISLYSFNITKLYGEYDESNLINDNHILRHAYLKENMFFIQYKNDNTVYLNDLLLRKNVYGTMNDILLYIEKNIELYQLIYKIIHPYNFNSNFRYYYKKESKDVDYFDSIDKFISLILKSENTFFDKNIFFKNLNDNEFSINIHNKYNYLNHATQFDLI